MEKIIQKGYELNLSKIDEGYLCSPVVVTAYNRGKAKVAMFQKIGYDGLKLAWSQGEGITFLNMPIRRNKEADVVEFEGTEMKRYKIEQILRDRDKEAEWQKVLNDPSITHCYIKKGNYYRPNYSGYTDFRHRAGIYTKQDAIGCCRSCGDLWVLPIDNNEHNAYIQS